MSTYILDIFSIVTRFLIKKIYFALIKICFQINMKAFLGYYVLRLTVPIKQIHVQI